MHDPVHSAGGGDGSGSTRRRILQRPSLGIALVLAAGVALTLYGIGVSVRLGDGGSARIFPAPLNTPVVEPAPHVVTTKSDDGVGDDLFGKKGKDGTPRAEGVAGAQRAYVVVFPDVQDPLLLERAVGLWRSLEAFKNDGDDIVAIVPRHSGQQLLDPLADIGYRVLARKSPAPIWRASGRFVQQTMALIGAGWGSSGGTTYGHGHGHGWNLLALEALSLTEYKEVVVLDQKMVIYQAAEQPQSVPDGRSGENRGSTPAEAAAERGEPVPGDAAAGEVARGVEDGGGNRRRFLGGGDSGGGEVGGEMQQEEARETSFTAAARAVLSSLVPEGGDWSVAYAAGDGSSSVQGEGLQMLPGRQRDLFGRQHVALMAMRPDEKLYDAISELLCKEDSLFWKAYPGPEYKSREERLERDYRWEQAARSFPLLQLAVDFAYSGDEEAKLPLEICGGGEDVRSYDEPADERSSKGRTVREEEWRWTGAALPIVWCSSPLPSVARDIQLLQQERDREQEQQRDQQEETGQNDPHARRLHLQRQLLWTHDILRNSGTDRATGDETDSAEDAQRRLTTVASTLLEGWRLEDPGGGASGRGYDALVDNELKRELQEDEHAERVLGHEIGEGSRRPHPAAAIGGVPRETSEEHQLHRRDTHQEGLSAQAGAGYPYRGWGEARVARRRRLDEVFGEEAAMGGGVLDEGEGVQRESAKDVGEREQGKGVEQGGGGGQGDVEYPSEIEGHFMEGGDGPAEGSSGSPSRFGAGTLRLAWIPGDPCSCVDAPGAVGEACRGWMKGRVPSSRSQYTQHTPSKLPEIGAEAVEHETVQDESALALSACEDGVFVDPRRPPPLPAEQAARAANTATATNPAQRSPLVDGNGEGRPPVRDSSEPPPPLWQDAKPAQKAKVTMQDVNKFQHFWLANVEKKLLMVAIPKVACTQVHALFLRMLGSDKWNSQLLHQIHHNNEMEKYMVSTMPNMTPERVSSILSDPTWTKGVFLRDPAERLLSCFLDKIVHQKSYSLRIFKAKELLSFERFVALTSRGAEKRFREKYPGGNVGITRKSNPHWRPQLFFGLEKFLPYFDFIGDFKHVRPHSEALLRRAGLWEEFGASGWGPEGKAAFFQRTTVQGHATGSQYSRNLYYTPPLLASVREAYADTDYKMLADLGWWNETAVQ